MMVAVLASSLGATALTTKFSTAGFYSVEGSPRTVASFNPGWRFYKGDVAGAEAIDFDDSQWQAANLPHGLEVLGENASGGRNYQGIAWYRKSFSAKPTMAGGRTFLYFEAVMGEAQIWVNGQHLAEHFGGYLPIAIDVTDALNADGKNVVAVMANNANSKTYPPGQPQDRLDFTYMGGIYRDSYLIQAGPVHVSLTELSETVAGGGIFAATLDVNGNDAKMEVRTEVTNSMDRALSLTVKTVLEDASGQELKVLSDTVELAGGASSQLARQFEVKGVRLWHTEDPYLHTLRTEVLYQGQVVDSLRTRVGIRLFEMRGPDGLFLNKKWIGKKLIGANRHQDYNYVGNALPNSGQWRDALLLREGGCHIVRAGHYPQDPAFYDACDELGLLTTTANPGWHFFNFKEKVFEERLYDDTRQLVRRDRNVASILMWETCINEFPSQPDYAMKTMHTIAHTEFPFPGMFTVADHHEAIKGGFDMYYHGNDKEVNSFNREYGDGGEVDNWYSQNATTRVKMEWGEKPLLQQSITQAATLSQRFATSKVRIGGALWAGIDHHRGYHPDPFRGGLLNAFRIPRYTYYLYQSQYEPDYQVAGVEVGPMVYNTHELTQISPEDVVIYSNCDEIRLTWLGQMVATQKPSTDGKFKHLPHPPFIFKNVYDANDIKQHRKNAREFDNAVMLAEGLIDGVVVARHEKRYAQRTTGLRLELAGAGLDLSADGSDFIPVRAVVVDQYGTAKVLASESVYFEVEGPAEIIGDNSTGANPFKTSFGVATALIRATTVPGTIKVTAHSNGLESARLEFVSTSAELPMAYDSSYMASSKQPQTLSAVVIITGEQNSDLPTDVKTLQQELREAQLEIVGKDQTIMDMMSKAKD
ncbi:Beta-galactosidase (EC [Lentimonas sp. CC11]|nr:Beta-galactosidase (EC [Lentimonas sp. CC11]